MDDDIRTPIAVINLHDVDIVAVSLEVLDDFGNKVPRQVPLLAVRQVVLVPPSVRTTW
jgi:hypothetical protein